MNKAFDNFMWENKPSDTSPLNARNLNKQNIAINEIDDRVIILDTTKFDKTDAQALIKNLTFNPSNGVFTIIYFNGATATIDTLLEKLAVNFDFDETTQRMIIYLSDGTQKYVDLSAFIVPLEFIDSATIDFRLLADGKVTAIVKEGSIEEKHLRPDYLADIRVETAKAESSGDAAARSEENANSYANLSKSYAIGTGGQVRPNDADDNAKHYSEQAKKVLDELSQAGAVTGVKGSKETVYRTGNVNITAQNIGALSGDSISNSRGGAGIPMIVAAADADSGGLMEIGKYIDFHDIGSQTDFDARLYYDQGKLISTSPIQAPGGTLAGDLVFQGRGKKLYFGNENPSCPYIMCNNGSDSDLEIYAPSGYVSINDNLSARKNSYFNGDVHVENQQKAVSLKLGPNVAIDFAGTGFETSSASIGGGYPVFYGHGCIFGDNIDEGIMEYVARGHYYDHCFCSINENNQILGTVTLSDGNVSCNTVNGKSADYAENWEWADSNSDAEDRVGLFVTFNGSKIRISKKGDPLVKVGVISGSPCIIGDSDDGREWKHKYLKDIYGRLLRDDEGGLIINPDYDPDQVYISRSARPEWDPVGTHGKLVVRDDGTCQEDGFCVPTDGGIATAAEDGFYVMERLDESHIRIYMR